MTNSEPAQSQHEAVSVLVSDFEIFRAHCERLEITLNMYEDLFEADAQQRELMRRMAPHFFADLSHILLNEFLVQVYKLTDGATSGRKGQERANLTFLRIQADLDACGLLEQGSIRQEIANYVEVVQGFRNTVAKDARNRVSAHLDRQTLRDLSKLGPEESGPGAHEEHERKAFFGSMYNFLTMTEVLLGLDLCPVENSGRVPGASAKELFQWVEDRTSR
jgi:hypothetical protein